MALLNNLNPPLAILVSSFEFVVRNWYLLQEAGCQRREASKPYCPMLESEKSEAYLFETPQPEVIVLDLDNAPKTELAYLTA